MVSTIGLAALVIMTVGFAGAGTLTFIDRRTEAIEEIVLEVQADLREARVRDARTAELISRGLRLDIQKVKLAAKVEFCALTRLQGERLNRCDGIRREARALARLVERFRDRLQARIRIDTASSDGGGTTTVTATATATATATRAPAPPPPNPPTVGESDQCPPKNPQC